MNKIIKIKLSFTVFLCLFAFMFLSNLNAQEKPDALKLYRNGRGLDIIGRYEDANKSYTEAVRICKQELQINPKNMDSYAVYSWCLFRLKRYAETASVCSEALKIANDPRIIETLGEANFYLGNYKESLKNMETYIDMSPDGERISVAHFFVGEIYRIAGKYNKADIAYSISVHLQPGNALWWYKLGIVREAANEKQSAAEAFHTALKLKPDYKEVMEAIKRIKI